MPSSVPLPAMVSNRMVMSSSPSKTCFRAFTMLSSAVNLSIPTLLPG